MAPEHEVGPGIGWVWRSLVRVMAPPSERTVILADLEEEAAQLSATRGRDAARRVVRWQVLHSVMPWMHRRVEEFARSTRRNLSMWHHGLWTDTRVAVRRLGQARGFTTLAVASLAIGIGAVSMVFSLAHALWLKPLPWHEPDRLVWIHARHEASGSSASLNVAELAAHEQPSATLTGVAGFSYGALIARVNGEPIRIVAHRVSPGLFAVLGVRPALGRDFLATDVGGAIPVVMLSHKTWLRRFGRDPAVVGKTMAMNEASFEIVGVMPREVSFPRGLEADVWLPADLAREDYGSARVLQAVARLAPGRSIEDAAAEAATRAGHLAQAVPATNKGWTAHVTPAGVTANESSRFAFQALLGIVGLFLMIACTNLAGLLLARNAGRRAELAVCLSMGAPRWRLARGLLVESALLAVAGSAAGVLLSAYGARALSSFMPANTPGIDDVVLSVPVVGVTVVVSIAAALFVGLLPALSLRSMRPADALSGSRSVARGTSRAQRGVVVVEIVLAVVLLVGAAAMLRSFAGALARDRGFDPRGLQALNVSLPFSDDSYLPTERRALAFRQMLDRVAAVPGVQSVSATTGFPGSSLGILGAVPVTPPGGAAPAMAALHAASEGYFDTMGIRLIAGRVFRASDSTSAPRVVIVNEMIAAQFPGGNPVGRHIPMSILGSPEVPVEIVGVVANIRLTEGVRPRVFVPLAQASPYWIDLVYRADSGSVTMPAVRQALRALNADLLLENESSLQSIIGDSLALEKTQSAFAALVGVLSTLVAGVGLYALMTFLAAQRRREFGIRLALGSQPRQLFVGAISRALQLVAAGVVIGVAVAALSIRALGSRVFGLDAAGYGAYATAVAVVVCVSIVAAWIPARRAMRTDPLTALRAD